MFCHKCGYEVPKDSGFCDKCGEKLTLSMNNTSRIDKTGAMDVTMQTDFVELFIAIEGTLDKNSSDIKFFVFIDDVKIGMIPIGGTETYKISSGEHSIKIDRCTIVINVPVGNVPVELFYKHNFQKLKKPEIVCKQNDIVTNHSVQSLMSFSPIGFAGLVIAILGILGVIIGFVRMPLFAGSVVTAEQHVAIMAAMDSALPIIIGGFVLLIVGAFLMIRSSPKEKK